MTKHTIGVVWKLERGDSVLDVNVKDVVILLSLVKFLASCTNSIDNLPYFLPLITRAVPLIESPVKVYAPAINESYLVCLGYCPVLYHFDLSRFST